MKTIMGRACSWHSSPAMPHRSIPGIPSPNGRPISATRACRFPPGDGRLFDLKKAAESKTYCDEFAGQARDNGVEITELSTHLLGPAGGGASAYDESL